MQWELAFLESVYIPQNQEIHFETRLAELLSWKTQMCLEVFTLLQNTGYWNLADIQYQIESWYSVLHTAFIFKTKFSPSSLVWKTVVWFTEQKQQFWSSHNSCGWRKYWKKISKHPIKTFNTYLLIIKKTVIWHTLELEWLFVRIAPFIHIAFKGFHRTRTRWSTLILSILDCIMKSVTFC